MDEATSELGRKVAHVVLRDSLRVRPGENVIVESWSESMPLAKSFVTEARQLGAHPLTLFEDEPEYWSAVDRLKPASFGTLGSHEWAALAKTHAYVFFFGPAEWPRLDNLPPRTRSRLTAYNMEWYRRAARAKLRGARMWIGRTSLSAAARFGVDLDQWRDELLRATLVPPAELHRRGMKVGTRLRQGKKLTVSHGNGTQLELRLKHYPVQLDDGLVDAADVKAGNNVAVIPGGVVGAAVDESYAEGTFISDRVANLADGPVEGGQWTFRDGRLTSYSYGKGAEHFESPYQRAPKGRDRPAMISVGLNPAISLSPQMEDQELGTVMVRVGGNGFLGGKNRINFGSWLVLRGADLSIDGRPVVTAGKLA
jgi:leucyl aminopeptidase (aminopeptidase T)